MPQLFQVLRCYKCLIFQVHQTKKSNKFQCKVCGEKQSIKRHYGLGNGQECRKHVQKLNIIRGEADELKNSCDSYSDIDDDNDNDVPSEPTVSQTRTSNNSKWSDFVETEESGSLQEQTDENTMYLNDKEVVLEMPKKRRKTLGRFPKTIKKTVCSNVKNSDSENDYVEESQSIESHEFQTVGMSNNHIYNKQRIVFQPPPLNDIKLENSQPGEVLKNHIPSSHSSHLQNEVTLLNEKESYLKIGLSNKAQVNKFVPPPINKNSKWAQFAEEDDENNITLSCQNEEHEIDSMEQYSNSTVEGSPGLLSVNNSEGNQPPLCFTKTGAPQKLFSLCDDDDDLDDYLNI